tara:strand:+ start:254 stop:544 length:291 start_codon:yes stop_codon:yes gene_type:complete
MSSVLGSVVVVVEALAVVDVVVVLVAGTVVAGASVTVVGAVAASVVTGTATSSLVDPHPEAATNPRMARAWAIDRVVTGTSGSYERLSTLITIASP